MSCDEEIIRYNPKFIFPGNGLINVGNICYFNSLMQCVLSCPSIFEVLHLNRKSYAVRTNITANKLLDLYDAQIAGKDIRDLCIPVWHDIINASQKRNDAVKMDLYNQHDAHEGLLILLDLLDNIPEIKRLFEHRRLIKILCENCKKWCVKKEETDFVFEVEPDLKVPQLDKFKNISGDTRDMNEFLMKQNSYVDDDHTCGFCKSRGAKYKTTILTMIPEIITIVIKKYDKKINTYFPEFLTFKKKTVSGGKQKNLIYRIVAQSEHGGNMNGGHYWAICLRKETRDSLSWYRLDDSSVSRASHGPTENSYMLFYHFITEE